MFVQLSDINTTQIILAILLLLIIVLIASQGTQKRFVFNSVLKHFSSEIEKVDKSFGSMDLVHITFKQNQAPQEVTIEVFRKIAPFGIYGSFQTKTRITGASRFSFPYRLEIIKRNLESAFSMQMEENLLKLSSRIPSALGGYNIYSNNLSLTEEILNDEPFQKYFSKAGFLAHLKFNGSEIPQFYIFTDDSPISVINSILLIKRLYEHILEKIS